MAQYKANCLETGDDGVILAYDTQLDVEIELLKAQCSKMSDEERYARGLKLPSALVRSVVETNRKESKAICEDFTISNR